jgi:hypothetical protein
MQRTSRMKRGGIIAAFMTAVSCGEPNEPPVATRLEFSAQPTNAIAGAAIAPQVRVRVLDASGNAFTGPMTVTLTLTSSNGAVLVGTTSVAASNGVATFSNVRVEKAGVGYVLNASAGTLTGAMSNSFDVTHAAAAKLRFVDQPVATSAGQPFSPPVTVEITDQYDNRATSATNAVTISVAANDAGATVIGSTTVAADAGLAAFSNITLTRAGSRSLTASAAGLTPATSVAFVVELTVRARFCPADVSSGASFANFDDAIEATQSGGTIVVCDGTHAVGVTMNRPLTVTAEHPNAATLTPLHPEQSFIIWVREGGPGTYAFRDLNFVFQGNGGPLAFGTARLNPPVGRYDQVIIENNRFTLTSQPGLGIGVGISSSSIPTAKVIVRGNTFTGGSIGVRVDEAGTVEITNNEFKDQVPAQFLHNANIELSNGGPYTVRNNVVRGCGGRCILSMFSAAQISDNTVESSVTSPTQVGIEVVGGPATVSRNVIRGLGAVGDRNNVDSYGFKWAGILVQIAREAVTLNGNSIANARSGIWLHASRAAGSDNTVTLVRWGIETTDAGPSGPQLDVALHRNDLTDYVDALFVNSPPANGFASCNYWGSPAGPPSGNPIWFTPFSPVPIANKAEVRCP